MKRNASKNIFPQYYFWRSYENHEIDLVEEMAGKISCFEFKYTKNSTGRATKKIFLDELKGEKLDIINQRKLRRFCRDIIDL
jgi:hypothetical protein